MTFKEPEKNVKETDITKIPLSQMFIKKGPEYDPIKNNQKMTIEQYKTMQGFQKFGSQRTSSKQKQIYKLKNGNNNNEEDIYLIPSDISLKKPPFNRRND